MAKIGVKTLEFFLEKLVSRMEPKIGTSKRQKSFGSFLSVLSLYSALPMSISRKILTLYSNRDVTLSITVGTSTEQSVPVVTSGTDF